VRRHASDGRLTPIRLVDRAVPWPLLASFIDHQDAAFLTFLSGQRGRRDALGHPRRPDA
jgi:hypothetical protein